MATLNGGRGWASDACAASVHRMDAEFGFILPINSAGRTWAEQAEAYRKYKNGGPLALPPGQSVHESGNAIDWHVSVWGLLGLNRGLGWNGAPANRHGHRRTVSSETWHTEHDQSRDEYRGQAPAGKYAAPVADIQALANKLGATLAVDGDYGPATSGWVRAFQGDWGLTVDGIVGPATWAKMQEVANRASNPYAQYGGADYVRQVQEKGNRLGARLVVDGVDGPATQGWVRAFQGDHGLQVDGVAGPITMNKMDELLSPKPVGRNATSRPTVEIQKRLIDRGFDVGDFGADNDYGAGTTAAVIAFQKSVGLAPDGVYGDLTDAALFPPAQEQPPVKDWPVNGRNATTRPTVDIQNFLLSKGFSVGSHGADNVWGADTSVATARWQASVGLEADGVWGPQSDAKAFPGVALPDAPTTVPKDSTYGKKLPTYPGATWADVSPNKSVRDGDVNYFVIHHAADPRAKQTQIDRFMVANDRNVSPNWFIGSDGSVAEIVPPDDYRAWTTGQFDHKAVTVETQNTSGDPTWGISEKSHEAIAQLVAWAADRYDFPIDRQHVIGHREVPGQATACPGPAMDLEWIVRRAQQIAAPVVSPEPEPQPPVVDYRSTLEAIRDLADDALGE